jgi:hypothetical protein
MGLGQKLLQIKSGDAGEESRRCDADTEPNRPHRFSLAEVTKSKRRLG